MPQDDVSPNQPDPSDSRGIAAETGVAPWEGGSRFEDPRFENPQLEDSSVPTDEASLSDEELAKASELAEPFVGQWNQLISTTNWEKGRIISEWRQQLIESGVDATQYSDEAWSRRVGGVTAPHVGRLRRVYDRFADSYQSYQGLYWSHFLAALDWQDAPMWLQGATEEKWSVSAMREKRWQAEGAVESQRPSSSQIVDVDVDEDFTIPAQGDGDRREYDNESGAVAAGPSFEGPDFGDEEELQSLGGQPSGTGTTTDAGSPEGASESSRAGSPIQPFIGLPELPDDLNDAIESLKLSLLRHKADGWRDVEMETVQRYLDAIALMIRS